MIANILQISGSVFYNKNHILYLVTNISFYLHKTVIKSKNLIKNSEDLLEIINKYFIWEKRT